MWNFSKKKAAEVPPPKRQKHGTMLSFFAGGEEGEGEDEGKRDKASCRESVCWPDSDFDKRMRNDFACVC
jgi:hypothetical protein